MRFWLRRILPLLLGLALLGTASAAQIMDAGRDCGLFLNYALEDAPLKGVQVRLYRVADMNQSGNCTLAGDFAGAGLEKINGLNDEESRQAAMLLAGYVDAKGISALKSARSNAAGALNFSGLKGGMYLLAADNLLAEEKVYRFEPMLVRLPAYGADGEWIYQLNMKPKVEVLDRGTTELRVVKVWKDGQDENRPDSIQVKLLGDGKLWETVELSALNNWRYAWSALDNALRWQLVETQIPGYTVSLKQDGQLVTITNTKISDTPTGGDSVLPQTGLIWWPVPLLAGAGMLVFLLGWLRRRRNEHEEES